MAKSTKQAAKGQKKIVEENKATLAFYWNLAFGVNCTYTLVIFAFMKLFKIEYVFVLAICVGLHVACYKFMASMSKAKYAETGHLIDSGVDLNMEGGIAEHVKDLLILTSGCQLLSLISNYFWFLWLLVPVRLFWLVWINFLGPYITQPDGNSVGISERKQKRMERRGTKRQNR